MDGAPDIAKSSVFVDSETIETPIVKGYEFSAEQPTNFDELFAKYAFSGFQATNLGNAIEEINKMLYFKFKPDELQLEEGETIDIYGQLENIKCRPRECKIFMGITSNLISSGMREIVKFIVKHKMVDVIVCTAGGIEEDFIKCLAPTHIGNFHMDGANLRSRGLSMF